MRSKLVLVASLISVSAVLAGCVSGNPLASQSTSDLTGKWADILAHPPGADVKPTGVTKEFTLYLMPMVHEPYPGVTMNMWGFSLSDDPKTATVPGPEIRVTEGDRVIVHFRPLVAGFNHTIHWHGLSVPNEDDGVPFITQTPTEPGQSSTYDFIAKPAGTYWYHCHVDPAHHLDMGMYGAFIVEP
ncbi:MAG: multicopper oxidase domain-containing protein, partial [Thermoplasmatota archaeon]